MLLKVLVLCKTKITWHEWPMRQYRWNKKRSFNCSNIGTIFSYIGEQNQVSPNEFFQSSLLSRTCLCLKAFRGQKSLLQNEGDIWGGGGRGPTQQYRNKNWQIPKSPCRKSTKCRCLIYDRSCLRKVVSISCLISSSMYAPEINLNHCQRMWWEDLEFIGTTISKCPVIKCNNNSFVD